MRISTLQATQWPELQIFVKILCCLFFYFYETDLVGKKASHFRLYSSTNVCSVEKYTKRSSNTLLSLVYFSAEQTLPYIDFFAGKVILVLTKVDKTQIYWLTKKTIFVLFIYKLEK